MLDNSSGNRTSNGKAVFNEAIAWIETGAWIPAMNSFVSRNETLNWGPPLPVSEGANTYDTSLVPLTIGKVVIKPPPADAVPRTVLNVLNSSGWPYALRTTLSTSRRDLESAAS